MPRRRATESELLRAGPVVCFHAHCVPHLWGKILKFTLSEGQRHWGPEKLGNSPKAKRQISGQHHPASSRVHALHHFALEPLQMNSCLEVCSRVFPLYEQHDASHLLVCLLHCVLALLLQNYWLGGGGVGTITGTPLTYLLVSTCLTSLKATKRSVDLSAHQTPVHIGRNILNAHERQTPRAMIPTKHRRPVYWQLRWSGHVAVRHTHFTNHLAYHFWNDVTCNQFFTLPVSTLFQNLHIFLYYTTLYSQNSSLKNNATRFYSQTASS